MNELDSEFEAKLRGMINPAYEDVVGTESYERKRLLGEIDRLRAELKSARELVEELGAYPRPGDLARLGAVLRGKL